MSEKDTEHKEEVTQKLEAMLADLFVLDPAFKKDERVLRMLLRDMLSVRPQATLDHAFAAHLRDHLSYKSAPHVVVEEKPKSKPHGVIFWAFRFAPVGVVAMALVLMLYPQLYQGPTAPRDVSPTISTNRAPSLDMNTMESQLGRQGPIDQSILNRIDLPDGSLGVTKYVPGPDILINAVMPVSGYVVVYRDQNGLPGQYLGASRLLPPGVSENVQIILARPVMQGEQLYLEQRASNGDMRFDPVEDPQVTRKDGSVVSIVVEVTQ